MFLTDWLQAKIQALLPQHGLSRIIHWLMRRQQPMLKNAQIRWFIRTYQVDMSQAAEKAEDFSCFNAFFTRRLTTDARPIAVAEEAIVCPADATVSQQGYISAEGCIFQAKGHHFDVNSLLGGSSYWANQFAEGTFVTLYLSPRDYHRVHMPLTGRLQETCVVPGRLFSVNEATTRAVPSLFSRNERVVTIFETNIGPMAVILVGALLVGSIETVWQGELTPPHRPWQRFWRAVDDLTLQKGQEMGRFNMGSTVILLFPPKAMHWLAHLQPGVAVRMGEAIGGIDLADEG